MDCENYGHVGAFLHVTSKIWSTLAVEESVLWQRGLLVRKTPYSPFYQSGEGETKLSILLGHAESWPS